MRIFVFIFPFIFLFQASFAAGQIIISPKIAHQGKTFVVLFKSDKPLKEISGSFLGIKVPFYKADEGFRGIIGVSALAKTGSSKLEIVATDEAGGTESICWPIKISATQFHADKLVFIASQKKEKLSSQKIANDQDQIMEVLTRESNDQMWSGRFLMPIKGRITSAYGSYRLYNGKRLGDHRGTDIGGNPAGTLIKAANSGVVAFARLMPAFGSVVVLDHGQGIHSIYMHMSKRLVELGEEVKKGQYIGRVGSTGISTGPHLHFGLSVHGVRVDAMEWVRRQVAD